MADMSAAAIRASVCASLAPRCGEVERAILSRIWTVSDAAGAEDEDYAVALQTAVAAGVGHGLASVKNGADSTAPIPPALFAEARQAARSGVTLEVELHRYFAAYTIFCDYVMQAGEEGVPLRGRARRQTFHALAAAFERLIGAIVTEYRHEEGQRARPATRLQIDLVRKLLAGEPAAAAELAYEFDDWHVGAIARGQGAITTLRSLAGVADRRLLIARPGAGTVWAWFGGRRKVAVAELTSQARLDSAPDAVVALGEPARGIDGWRLTHQQAAVAFSTVKPGATAITRYADVGLLASISGDRLLSASLEQLYLVPLARGRDGGATLRKTLQAYFEAGRNVSSAAAALGVSRQTVGNRLRIVEERLGRTLESCTPEIEIALRLVEACGDAAGGAELGTASPRPIE